MEVIDLRQKILEKNVPISPLKPEGF